MRQVLEKSKPDRTGIIDVLWRDQVLDIRVSKTQMHRALRIFDALIKALEQRGAAFAIPKDSEREFMRLRIGDDWVGIGISELVDKAEREPKDEKERESLSWQWQKWQFSPTGRLQFRIFESEPKGARRSWSDCKFHKLEEKLGEIVEWIPLLGALLHALPDRTPHRHQG